MSAECSKCGYGLPYEAECSYCALRSRLEKAEEALRPFSELLGRARALGHTSGSTCAWRLAYDDLVRVGEALASHPEEKGP